MTRLCIHCNKGFGTNHNTQMTCSVKCRMAYQKAQKAKSRTYIKKIFEERNCKCCNILFKPATHNQLHCSKTCGVLSQQHVETRETFKIFRRDAFRCVYCGKSSIEHGVVLNADHIFPVIRGGQDVASNLVTSCKACNTSKKHNLLRQDIQRRLQTLVEYRNKQSALNPQTVIKL